jgi:putative ABC transport system permease protein
VAIGNISTPADAQAAVRQLSADRHVDTFSGVGVADVRINGLDQPLLWITTDHGIVGPTALRGRLPVVIGEVALATGTMRRAGAHLGGIVRVGSGVLETPLRVVGEVLGPAVLVDGVRLDTGVVLTHDAATALGEGVYQDPTSFLVRFRPGAGHGAELAGLKRAFPGSVLQPTMPGDVTNVERLAALPSVLAGLLMILGLGGLFVALQATVDRRRSQLGALWAMGFSRRQLRDTVIWQSGALAAAAVVIGLPLGALAGRMVWVVTANTIGVPAPAVVPWTIVLVAAGVVLAAALAATAPARRAAQVVPPGF